MSIIVFQSKWFIWIQHKKDPSGFIDDNRNLKISPAEKLKFQGFDIFSQLKKISKQLIDSLKE